MTDYRPFLNSDPPHLAEIWCRQPPSRGLHQPMSATIFDELVLAQPYFERHGLIVASQDGVPVGFAHAGFGPTSDGAGLDRSVGATGLLMIQPDLSPAHSAEVADELLRQSESYLAGRGALRLLGGATNRLAAFYLGLYGGSKLPGVLRSDEVFAGCLRRAGYRESPGLTVLERRLADFRPATDRQLMQLRRQHRVVQSAPPTPTSWWEASQRANWETSSFEVSGFSSSPPVARFWDIEPLASSWRVHAMGLWDIALPVENRGLLAIYLLGESLRTLQDQGISVVEVQVEDDDHELTEACLRLGFYEVDRSLQFNKPD